MGKTKPSSKEAFFYCNLLIFLGLAYVYYTMNRNVEEGITNMNCCGGVEAGVHYSETDTKPPPYIRRCFKSSTDGGETVYQWSGFPCSNKGSSDCCHYKDKSIGECVPTTKGGYCKDPSGSNKVFYRRGDSPSPYVKRSNDNILDINDVIDMKDYYYDRGSSDKVKSMSPEMQRFMARRSKNEVYMEQHLRTKQKRAVRIDTERRDKLEEETKYVQIVSSITIIHLLVLVAISITIRQALIMKIQNVLNLIYQKYLEFSGKTI